MIIWPYYVNWKLTDKIIWLKENWYDYLTYKYYWYIYMTIWLSAWHPIVDCIITKELIIDHGNAWGSGTQVKEGHHQFVISK